MRTTKLFSLGTLALSIALLAGSCKPDEVVGPMGPPGPEGPPGPQGEPGWVDIGAIIDSILQVLPPGATIEVYEGESVHEPDQNISVANTNSPGSQVYTNAMRHRQVVLPDGLNDGDQLFAVGRARAVRATPAAQWTGLAYTHCVIVASAPNVHPDPNDLSTITLISAGGVGANDAWSPAVVLTHYSNRDGTLTWSGPATAPLVISLYARPHTITAADIGNEIVFGDHRLSLIVVRNP